MAQTATCQDLTVQLDNAGSYSFDLGSTTPQVDAEQTVFAGIYTAPGFAWQSFTPTVDGILHSVSFGFNSVPAGDIDLVFRSGQGTGGALLGSQTVTITSTGLSEFILPFTIDLSAGTEYTVELQPLLAPTEIQKNDGNLYADGRNNTSATSDFVFSTKILQRPDIDFGSTSAVGLESFDVSVSSFGCSDIGPNTVTLTVTDNTSATATCNSTITVQDTENPVANCVTTTPILPLDGLGDVQLFDFLVDDGSSDNCGIDTRTLSVEFFNCNDVGLQPYTLTVTDAVGNSDVCSGNVEIVDNSAPNAVCTDHILELNSSGAATLTVANINNGSSDNCGIAIGGLSLSATAFDCGSLGDTIVTLTVTDVNGNNSSCTATVTVVDNENPTIVCPSDIVICATTASGVEVDYTDVTGDDNCNFVISQTDISGFTDGDVFPVGTTVQEWTNTDIAGNSTSCSFTIIVDAKPVADYSFSPGCEGETTFFTDLSTIDASSSIVSWQWDMNDGSSLIGLVDPSHVFADTGSYDVELIVTSTEGCTDTSIQTVDVGPIPTASFTVSNACEGNITSFVNTSTIDDGTLTYVWDFGDGNTSTDEDPDHTYSVDGTYTVTLTATSDNGCEDATTASVEVFDSPTALFTASTECFGGATEFTNLSTGTGTLAYSWDFGDSSPLSSDANPTYTYATVGSFTAVLTVTNSNLCVSTHTVTVTVNELPTVDFSFSDVCEGTPATFTNSSSAGTYSWDFDNGNSSTLTSPSQTYATAGTYDVALTVTDANFCINSGTQQIEIFDLPDFTLTTSDVLCFGEATGSITVNPQGTPTFPWDFSINNGTPQVNDTFIGLAEGSYDVTVTDNNGCEFTVSGAVGQPSDTLGIDVISLVDILCNGEFTGEINVEGTGGTSPYSYSINAQTPQLSGMFSGLDADAYDISIIDGNNCIFDTTITLIEPDTLVLGLVTAENLLCNGDNSGSISVVGTGGAGAYEYNLDGGTYQADGAFTGLAAADYIVGVRDANGCEDTLQITLTEPGILMLSLLNSEDANCFGESNGLIEVGAASGTPGYQYSIDGVSFVGSGLFEGLSAGTYTATVQDANGCVDELTETIFEPSLLTIETNSTPVSCFGETTGEIEIIAAGGTPGPVLGYAFSIDAGNSFDQNGGTFSDLSSGTYLAVVADTNGCTASEGVIISQPSAAFNLTADITDALCLDSASGSVLLIGNGGTPTYTYSDDNVSFVTGNIFDGFAAGDYTLYAQDVNGCSDSIEFNVGEPATSVNITNILLNNPACPNEASGTATVQVNGGTPGYTYSGNGGNTFQSSQILTGFNGGNHLVVVQDANGCEASEVISMTSPSIFDFTIDTIIGVDCEGDFGGEISVTAIGGTPSYNYTLNGGGIQTNGTYTNLTDGTYTIAIMDVNGCMFSEAFTVPAAQAQPVAAFNFNFSGTAVLFNNNSMNGDSYLWEFGNDSTSTEESPVYVYEEDGDYTVTLTVSNECGSSTISKLVSTTSVGINDGEVVSFSLFPNPASSVLNIQSSKSIDENLTLEIISISGQTIKTDQLNKISSADVIAVDVSGLSQGVYFLRLFGAKQQSVLRFDITK